MPGFLRCSAIVCVGFSIQSQVVAIERHSAPPGARRVDTPECGAVIGHVVEKTWLVQVRPSSPQVQRAMRRWVSTTWGVYDTSDGRRVAVFDGDPAFWPQMYGLAFCSDGTRLVGVSPSGVMQLWETGSWRMVDQLQLPGERLISVTWSPDRKSLVTGGDDGTVRLFHTDPLREVKVIGQHSARIKSVAFSPDGRSVASAGDDQTIALWSVNGGLIDRIGTHAAPVLSVAFSPDGKKLVSGENDNSVRIYKRHRALWGHRLN